MRALALTYDALAQRTGPGARRRTLVRLMNDPAYLARSKRARQRLLDIFAEAGIVFHDGGFSRS